MTTTTQPTVLGYYECEDCGHQQTTEIFHAEFATDVEGITLTGGYSGSAADFCDLCDSGVRMLAIEVDEVVYEVDKEVS